MSYKNERAKTELHADPSYCPLSHTKGKRLLQKTLANHIQPKDWNCITPHGYFFCPQEDCPVIYFNNDLNNYFAQEDLRTPVMHKMPIGTEDRPICYCKNVLEATIMEELTVKQCCESIEDIQQYTEANTGKNCSIANPTGRCCREEVKQLLDWVMINNDRFKVEAPIIEQALTCCNKMEQVVIDSNQ
ncbi:MAG: hypothetical protein ACXAD7_17255 [Candidatus Kariarchaeaceae archaeon]